MQRVVVIAGDLGIPIPAYVEGWRRAKVAPPMQEYTRSLCGWWPATAAEILDQFREGLHDRINRHAPGYGKGRKWDADWQREVGHAARRLNTPRLIVRPTEVPSWLRDRMAHRLYVED